MKLLDLVDSKAIVADLESQDRKRRDSRVG